MRSTISKYFSKSVEHKFETKLETFKAGIRDNERELDQIRSFLVSARRDRDSVLQAKRLEAAETLMRARDALAQFTMLVEYMKILNIDEILKSGDDPKITEFIETLINPFNVDEKIGEIKLMEKSIPRLYLSEKALNVFDAYQNITLSAVMLMKLLGMPLPNKGKLIKSGHLSEAVIRLVPHSKGGFDQHGESYAYEPHRVCRRHWVVSHAAISMLAAAA